jgi:hypothetical protein
MDRHQKCGIAFGEAVSISSPPSRSQMYDRPTQRLAGRLESGFGGWADEKTEIAREAVSLTSRKKVSSTTFDNSSSLHRCTISTCSPYHLNKSQRIVKPGDMVFYKNSGRKGQSVALEAEGDCSLVV